MAYKEPEARLVAVTNAPAFSKPAALAAKSCDAVLVDRSQLMKWQGDLASILIE